MAALTTLMTRFCAGEDSWLARSDNTSRNLGTSDTKDANGRPRRNRHKRDDNGDNTNDTATTEIYTLSLHDALPIWEDLEAAFLDNFQGTYVRPPDNDDQSHIIQQPEESARQFWTRFLAKKNQIVDCPDAEALAAFKHNIRDEWLARHLG